MKSDGRPAPALVVGETGKASSEAHRILAVPLTGAPAATEQASPWSCSAVAPIRAL